MPLFRDTCFHPFPNSRKFFLLSQTHLPCSPIPKFHHSSQKDLFSKIKASFATLPLGGGSQGSPPASGLVHSSAP